MLFVSPVFLFIFLPITLFGHLVLDNKYKNLWLMIASFVFYAWGGLGHALIIIFSSVVNYFLGKLIIPENRRRKVWFIVAIIFNVSILAFFKYFNFIIENINGFFVLLDIKPIDLPYIKLPIGISFFTFQIISYIIDVYRENVKPQRKIIDLGLYIMMFPQLIAGPIVRYIDIEGCLEKRNVTFSDLSYGIERFIIGFAKKLLVANAAGYIADQVFNGIGHNYTLTAWLGIISYAIQIYFDFSAYSDMAIGLGMIFGFHFNENFNHPYSAKSIQDFWRRWHISLSTWFRDYLYIPLGGNRKGSMRTYINLLIVFFITGLWHGASWNFVVWGLYHGFFLVIERLGFGQILNKLPVLFRRIYVILVVLVGWVFFRSPDLNFAINTIVTLFNFNFQHFELIPYVLSRSNFIFLITGIIFSFPITNKINFETIKIGQVCIHNTYVLRSILLLSLFVVSLLFLSGSGFNPFIYYIF